jgi:hypothetical protein
MADSKHTWDEAKAKADRLRDAAPDLLEALKGVTDLYCELVNSGDAGCWNPETVPNIVIARAAIAKAEGRS